YFQGTDLVALPLVVLTAGRLELFLQHWSQNGLAPASVNKLRAMVRTAFNHARRAGLVHGHNPASDTKPRKVPRRAPAFLEPHEERHADCDRRRCPRCKMLLWAKAVPRRFRLHDTRHTTATLLLAAGVDLYAVARILRHTDPKVTFETYAHLVPGYLHAQIDRLPKLEPFAALVLHEPAKPPDPP